MPKASNPHNYVNLNQYTMKSAFVPVALILFAITVSSCGTGNDIPLKLPSIIGNNMVLQQEQEVKLWGWGSPGTQVVVETSWGVAANTIPNPNGEWELPIRTPTAGGPFQITIKQKDTIVLLENVLIGEVWICSGQSNMEMPMMGWPPSDPIMDSEEEIARANHPMIRLFTVTRALSVTPEADCVGQWQECSPETVRSFSATAYFFGRKLHRELGVPVGLIHSSWGGTPAESWVSKDYLAQLPEFEATLSKIEASTDSIKVLRDWQSGLKSLKVDIAGSAPWAELDFGDSLISNPNFDYSPWPTMELPRTWETTQMGAFDGVVWFRKDTIVPEQWLGKDLVLSLGPIDDMDITYVNGERVGAHEHEGFWQTERVYPLPSQLIGTAKISIAIRVLDHQGGGGIFGRPEAMRIYPKGNPEQSISLAGQWSYLPVAEYQGGMFYLYDAEKMQFSQRPSLPVELIANTPTLLYNAMIHPITKYRIRGAIWYQGESNTGRPQQYRVLFPLLIESWRSQWGQGDFPFYFVQIAPYDYGVYTQSQALREAQLASLQVPNTGMVVTLDIGNPKNIHPANKLDVGERLALWALAKDYGQELVYSGPLYTSMEATGNSIVLSFNHTHGGLKAKGANLSGFQIAGHDRIFVPAKATIQGEVVWVKSSRVDTPVAVRYLWDNTSEASLFNGHGLPASSFRTDEWEY